MRMLLVMAGAISLAYGFDQQEKETVRQTFPAAARLEIDNVHGSIRVTGYNGSEIQMTAEKTIQAESQERVEAAKREVRLDISQSGDTLRLFVDGPFRCHCAGGASGWRDSGHAGYVVYFDFELKLPTAMAVRLATVNRGEIRLENTAGNFDVSNINGGIELSEVAGAGNAHTVNGAISARFARNPAANSAFTTVNGSIQASFPPDLNADVRVKTFNGSAYTDFPSTPLAASPPVAERRDGKFIYRADRFTGLRIGNGGPEFKFETLNGRIQILKRGQ